MPEQMTVEMNEFLPLWEVVYKTLRKAILRGEFKPGERLMEISLANRLGVSRTPVREALHQLENDGLVIMIPRKGAQVADMTKQELHDVLEIRRSLERLAVKKAGENLTPEIVAALVAAGREFRDMTDSDDLTAVAESDAKFHDIFFKASGNKKLIGLLEVMREQIYRFRVEVMKDKDMRKQLVGEHRKIVYALRDNQWPEAVKLMAEHIEHEQAFVETKLNEKEK